MLVILPGAVSHKQAGGLEQQYGDLVVRLASALHAGSAPAAQGAGNSDTGRMAYMSACAECHGPSGRGEGVFGASTFPPATDLTSALVRRKSDPQLFSIVKNGLGFTAMPGYGAQFNDADIGAIVAYVRSLQQGAF